MTAPFRPGPAVGPMIHLRGVAAFAELPPAHLSALAAGAEEVVLRRGAPFFEVGQPADAMFLIQDGWAEAESPGGGAARWGPGEVVGFLESLSREPVQRRISAGSDVVALKLDFDELRDACEVHFGIVAELLAEVAGRVAADPWALRGAVGASADAGALVRGDEPMDRVSRILALHRSPVFPSAGMDALAELAGQLEERDLEPGAPLWPPEDASHGAFLITRGRVELHSAAWPDPVALGPGAVPGLVTTLTEDAGGVRAVALSPVRALYVSGETLLDILEDHADMAFAFLGRLAACVLSAP